MDVFQLELPRIHARQLKTVDDLKAHLAELKRGKDYDGSYELSEDENFIWRVTYHSAYGDSVDERRSKLVLLGYWIVWSSALPGRIRYVKSNGDVFPAALIPKEFLTGEARLIATPLAPAKRRAELDATAQTLWDD